MVITLPGCIHEAPFADEKMQTEHKRVSEPEWPGARAHVLTTLLPRAHFFRSRMSAH